MIRLLAIRELRSMFYSPLAWAVLAVVQFLLAAQFFKVLGDFIEAQGNPMSTTNGAGVTELVAAPLFGYAGVILLFAAPMITCRVFAEERRHGTLNLLLSAPVTITEIVLGKYLGLLAFFLIMTGLATLMPLSLTLGTSLDWGTVLACMLGLTLLTGTFSAFGIFVSSLTRYPALASIITFGLLLWLWLIEWTTRGSGIFTEAVAYVSLGHHFVTLLKGRFESQDVSFFLLFIGLFLALTVWRLDAERIHG